MDDRIAWVKHMRCGCVPPQVAAVKISYTMKNPRRLFFKCRQCDFFAWLKEEDIIRVGDELEVEQGGIAAVTSRLDDLVNFIKVIMKMALIMYFILLFVVSK